MLMEVKPEKTCSFLLPKWRLIEMMSMIAAARASVVIVSAHPPMTYLFGLNLLWFSSHFFIFHLIFLNSVFMVLGKHGAACVVHSQ